MELGIAGRVAMVAAASKGIGLACAKTLVQEGCRVSICSRSAENLGRACEQIEGTVRGYVCDVSLHQSLEHWVRATSDELGSPEILVTNTGGPPAGTFDEISDEQWQTGVDSTLMNVVRLFRLVSPKMIERRWGRIVHITSLVAKEPAAMLPISSTLRAGITALTRLQASHVAAEGVTVNGVLPGHTMTDRQVHLASLRAQRLNISVEEALTMQAKEIPIGRMAEPEEVAAAVAFLCSEKASAITGVSLLVDGGITHGLG